MRTSARTSATPAQVWEVLGQPSRWPEFEPLLRRVRGTHGPAAAGQTLVGVSRVANLAVPLDVREVDPARRLGAVKPVSRIRSRELRPPGPQPGKSGRPEA